MPGNNRDTEEVNPTKIQRLWNRGKWFSIERPPHFFIRRSIENSSSFTMLIRHKNIWKNSMWYCREKKYSNEKHQLGCTFCIIYFSSCIIFSSWIVYCWITNDWIIYHEMAELAYKRAMEKHVKIFSLHVFVCRLFLMSNHMKHPIFHIGIYAITGILPVILVKYISI